MLLVVVLTALYGSTSVHAGTSMPKIFGDNMVLQRDIPVPVWGTAIKGEEIKVSFNGQVKVAVAGQDGKWMVKLDAMEANTKGEELVVNASNTITFKNVVVGEVWLCSGQSNMTFPLSDSLTGNEVIKNSDEDNIRIFNVKTLLSTVAADDVTPANTWAKASPNTIRSFSAVGYFFAKRLQKELNVTVGLIGSNWGGTRIEPWTPPAGFRNIPELKAISDKVDGWLPSTPQGKLNYSKAFDNIEKWLPEARSAFAVGNRIPEMPSLPGPLANNSSEPTAIYNGMIHGLIPYAIRGAIWYQGEANVNDGVSYLYKMQALIHGWRSVWSQGDFPFYFVQIANYGPCQENPNAYPGWANLREGQRRALEIENTGMAVVIDIGNPKDIHPKNKIDVGERLALWALAKTYRKSDIVFSGPIYKTHKIEGNKVIISFDNVGKGLMVGLKKDIDPTLEVKDGKLGRFSISDKNKKWFWADASIVGDTVVVSSDKVTEPMNVRYAYQDSPDGANLYNKNGLPASPFTTEILK
ncbi:MAG: hypothetical protein A2X45_11485 [Lentisphaerae bacterium GWF2_50_93]|nr:MAG: hypothetical protein A2X45_11485 [Lentisphaerae bacterium GWF2_50_93]